MNSQKFLIAVIFLALIIRIFPLNFPNFTNDEARIADRGNALRLTGKDELGRLMPLLFNSSNDYQLPTVSYLTVLGTFISNSDFGVRLPFILIGTTLVFMVYLISESLFGSKKIAIFASLLTASSPALVFLSRTPNEIIVSVLGLSLIFYLLIQKKIKIVLVLIIFLVLFLTSKQNWLILPFFTFLTAYFFGQKGNKLKVALFSLIIFFVLALLIFLQIPQAKRSLLENNFTLFSDITIKNGIEALRAEGVKSGWLEFLSRALFNKVHFLTVGALHWFSHLSPSVLFGTLDKTGIYNFTSLGVFSKATIIPVFLGFIFLLKDKKRVLLIFPLVLTFPAIFLYPNYSPMLIVLTAPLFAIFGAIGLERLNAKLPLLIIFLISFELLFNLMNLGLEEKYTNVSRPSWIEEISRDVYVLSLEGDVFVSDDITYDLLPFISWFNHLGSHESITDIGWPYKYRQTHLGNISLIGADSSFFECLDTGGVKLVLSKRDLEKIKDLKFKISRIYKDVLGQEAAAKIDGGICAR